MALDTSVFRAELRGVAAGAAEAEAATSLLPAHTSMTEPGICSIAGLLKCHSWFGWGTVTALGTGIWYKRMLIHGANLASVPLAKLRPAGLHFRPILQLFCSCS